MLDVAAVVDVPVLVVNVADTPEPVPRLLGALRISVVACVTRKASAEVKEDAVRDGCTPVSTYKSYFSVESQICTILVVVAVVEELTLPAQSAAASVIPSTGLGLRIPHSLR